MFVITGWPFNKVVVSRGFAVPYFYDTLISIFFSFTLQLNSYDLTRATLDHATRIVRLLSTCTYVRIEAQLISSKFHIPDVYWLRVQVDWSSTELGQSPSVVFSDETLSQTCK